MRVVQCVVFAQVQGGQRPAAAGMLAVQCRQHFVRLFCRDSGPELRVALPRELFVDDNIN